VAGSVRINSVSIYPSAGTLASWTWINASAYARDLEINQDQPLGTTMTSVLTTRPPSGTLCADWYTSGLNTFIANCVVTTGSVIDIDLSFTLINTFGGFSAGIVTGVLGNLYYVYLDGATSHKLQPASLPNTF
jgi:hypothetical protein